MRCTTSVTAAALTMSAAICALGLSSAVADEVTTPGQRLDPALYGPSWIESMDAAIERNRTMTPPVNDKDRNGRQGVWVVPSRGATMNTRSGDHNVVNKWGDTNMGVGFPGLVNVNGAYFAGQGGEGVWTRGIRVIGYRQGREVGQTPLFTDISDEPAWMDINLRGVDRIEIVATAVFNGGGWYAMDDLTFTTIPSRPSGEAARQAVINFDDLNYRTKLTGSNYAGLTWETGTGDFAVSQEAVHSPEAPQTEDEGEGGSDFLAPTLNRGTAPDLLATYQGVIRGDAGSWSYPPDTDGAIGPNHFVETVNRNFAVYDKETGQELVNILLGAFLPGSNGDPRTVFDHHSGRWIVHVCDFSASATLYLAVSLTDDPTGDWFKTSFVMAQGQDAGRWPDYPTLGVDENGIYVAAYMVYGPGMSIFAIDKAPLVDDPPYLGTITAWRNLPWEGAIQPAHTYGSPGTQYFISLNSSTSLRLRKVDPPLTSPTMTDLGTVSVSSYSDPPNAPALGSSVPLNTVDDRLMMSAYRDGSIWTAHTISANGKAGCRWYEIDVATKDVIQEGTVTDSSLYYFFPSIMVNEDGDVAMGFTGSNSSQYAACYYTGRLADDPLGEMATPIMFKEGTGPQNNVDGYGRNRWGDYSYTTLDPVDGRTFWCLQEYGHGSDVWGTYMAVLSYGAPDCNDNGIDDACDIDCGEPGGECDVPGCGQSRDCNLNGVPDECEGLYCDADVTLDCQVNIDDVFAVLAAWGPCNGCPEDLDDNGTVDIDDLFIVLGDWGPCE